MNSWLQGQSKTTVWAVGTGVALVSLVALYRNVRNWTKASQTTDQPLDKWVRNTDYDESFACDVLTLFPRSVSRWMARAAFYPTLKWTQLKAKFSQANPWMSVIDENIVLGALPVGRAQTLKDMGVGLVVNTCEEWDGNADEYARLGIRQIRAETVDYTPPELADVEQVVFAMQQYLKDHPDGKIYCHCKAGRGRSATVLVCYYVQQGMGPLQAQRLLTAKRPQVSRRCWKRKVVKDWVRKHVLKK